MIIEHIMRFIAPHRCLGCATEGTLLCEPCLSLLPSPTPALQACASADLANIAAFTTYQGLAKDLVYKLKFERAAAAAQSIAQACSKRVDPIPPALVTYLPTAPERVRQRGYDQAELIARHVAKHHGLPYVPLLRRVTGVRQLGANARVRQAQLVNAFRVVNQSRAANQRIILVDDVITTGSSLRSAAATLRAAGAAQVDGLVFAQAL